MYTVDTCLYLFTLGIKSPLAFGNDLDIDFNIRYLQNLITEREKFLLCSGIGMTVRNLNNVETLNFQLYLTNRKFGKIPLYR
jgi:hypothetical protein